MDIKTYDTAVSLRAGIKDLEEKLQEYEHALESLDYENWTKIEYKKNIYVTMVISDIKSDNEHIKLFKGAILRPEYRKFLVAVIEGINKELAKLHKEFEEL